MSAKKTTTSWFEPDAQAATSATSTTYYYSTPGVHYSSAQAAVQLTRSGLTWNGFQVYNKPVALSFAFLDNATASPRGDKGIVAFNSEQRAAALQSLQAWADVANIKFTQVSSGARLTFANYTQFADGKQANDQAYAYLPGTHKAAGSMWFNYNMANIRSPEHYEYGRQTLTHELGHALGLSHPGDYNSGNGVISYNASASYIEDSRQYSLMSYWSETNTGGNFYGHYAVAPLLHDIAAIQRLYGANMTTRTGNTVYGFGSNTGRDYYTAVHSNDALIFSIWDAGGNDTLNFSGYAQSQQINLNAQSFSDVGGLKGNVSIALGVVIENAIAGAGHDTLIGNAVANSLRGNGGNDRLYGNDGNDALYGDSGLDLLYGGNDNDALYGGNDSDTLYGDRGLDRLYGGESSDTLYGGNDSDTLYGENGSDRLFGGEGNDILYGGNNNDILYGENGNDRLYGGEGDDQLFGGNGNDIQYGENGNDRLYGGEGIDTLYGGNGNDQLFGENGNDRLEGGAGMDKLYGGGGMDKLYGGAHSDLFIFTSIKDSLPTLRDLIGDFTSGSDKIDLSALDSSAHPLHFTSKFTGKLGEIQMTWDVKAHLTHLSLNLTGDIHPDMTIDIAAHPDLRIDFIV